MTMNTETYQTVPVYGLRLVRERTERYASSHLPHAPAVARVASGILADRPQEILLVFALDARNRIRKVVEVARGGMSGLHVSVQDVLRGALVAGGASFVLSHNHPSGDPTPSAEDLAFTKRLNEAAKIVGCQLLDHVVVAGGEGGAYYSMLDNGVLS